MPAHHSEALIVANGHNWPELKTQVLCTEDAVSENELPLALERLRHILLRLEDGGPYRFVRPRNPKVLQDILNMEDADGLDGFVLPKADSETLPAWFKILERHERFWLMPTLETGAVFNYSAMCRLRDELTTSPFRPRLLSLRFGALDLLGLLSLRREAERSIYESPLGFLIDQAICIFRPAGLNLTAPGYECFDNPAGLADELNRDVGRGLFGKTALHPAQIKPIHQAYQVAPQDLETARALVDPNRSAIFRLHDRMCEKAVHTPWAKGILKRTEIYGLKMETRLDRP